jgi:hypothetical protein
MKIEATVFRSMTTCTLLLNETLSPVKANNPPWVDPWWDQSDYQSTIILTIQSMVGS